MQRINFILWFGPVVNEKTMLSTTAVSIAGNRWQHELLLALQKLGTRIFVANYIPEQMWPKGRLLMKGDSKSIAPGIEGFMASYQNFPYWRKFSLATQYFKKLFSLRRELYLPSLVITYNAPLEYSLIGRYAQKKFGIPWVCIVADGKATSEPDGLIFLSWGYYNTYPHNRKLHLDGGVSKLKFDPDVNIKPISRKQQIILYTGSLNNIGGADFLIKSFPPPATLSVE